MRFVRMMSVALLVGAQVCPAYAASVDVSKGGASINRGSGYTAIGGSTTAKAGDSVMASPDGSATITYGNGCLLKVEAGAVVVVPEDAACVPAAQAATNTAGNPYLIGGVVVAAGVGIAVLAGSGGSSSSPASP